MSFTLKALLLALLIVNVAASPIPARSDDEPECTKQGLGKLQLAKEDLTILGLTIGSTSMTDVQAKLGQAQVLPVHGDVSASHTICYMSPTDGTVLTLGTNGPGGGYVDLSEFAIWSREAKFSNVSACSQSKLVSRDLSTPSGIKLGLSLKQLNNIVGKRATTQRAVAHYELLCLQKMTPDEMKHFPASGVAERPYFDVFSSVDAYFAGAGASRISITKSITY
jgi:hypothetical protein